MLVWLLLVLRVLGLLGVLLLLLLLLEEGGIAKVGNHLVILGKAIGHYPRMWERGKVRAGQGGARPRVAAMEARGMLWTGDSGAGERAERRGVPAGGGRKREHTAPARLWLTSGFVCHCLLIATNTVDTRGHSGTRSATPLH